MIFPQPGRGGGLGDKMENIYPCPTCSWSLGIEISEEPDVRIPGVLGPGWVSVEVAFAPGDRNRLVQT